MVTRRLRQKKEREKEGALPIATVHGREGPKSRQHDIQNNGSFFLLDVVVAGTTHDDG